MFPDLKKSSSSRSSSGIYILKANGDREIFSRSKLERSLRRSGATRPLIDKIVPQVETKIHDGIKTSEIYGYAASLLHKEQKTTAVRYSLRRAVSELGPSGFAFEKYVAEIFKAQGYETKVDQLVQGECVEHEVDVVAWDNRQLIMVEAKFHNDGGMKSDLKVALYIKARFDDLRRAVFNGYGRDGRKMTQGWLITNTKFSSSAIQYGLCQNMKMVGWNFPHITNLHNMIEITGTIPLTVLTSLTQYEKSQLLEKGIVLCKQLTRPEPLLEIGINQKRITEILREAGESHQVV